VGEDQFEGLVRCGVGTRRVGQDGDGEEVGGGGGRAVEAAGCALGGTRLVEASAEGVKGDPTEPAELDVGQSALAEVVEEGIPAEVGRACLRHGELSLRGPLPPPGKSSPGVRSLSRCTWPNGYGAEVIGISSDSPESHRSFANRFNLPFLLVSDMDGKVRERYGVPRTLGLFPGRVTYLIDREGVVRHIFSSQFQPTKHVTEALSVLRTLRSEPDTQRS
jgi:peroxiredoxin Q/BCP